MEKFILIDGDSMLSRAFYGLPETAGFMGSGGVCGFLNVLFVTAKEEGADYLAAAFHLGEPAYRQKLDGAYKKKYGTAIDKKLSEQEALIREALAAMGVPVLEKEGFEAADIIGTLAKKSQAQGVRVVIATADRSLLQLADERITVHIWDTGFKSKPYTPEEVKNEYHVAPEELPDVMALCGRLFSGMENGFRTKNLFPGEKTAASVIETYKSIENAYSHVEEIRPFHAVRFLKENYPAIRLCKSLACICTECGIDFSYTCAGPLKLFTPAAFECIKKLGFQTPLSHFFSLSEENDSLEGRIRLITDVNGAEEVFSSLGEGLLIGLEAAVKEQELVAAALCTGENEIYCFIPQGFMRAEYLAGKLRDLCKRSRRVSVLNLKPMLPVLGAEEGDEYGNVPFFDAGVAAYLLNPLQDSYSGDRLARDYLGMELETRAALLGKLTVKEAFHTEEGKAASWLCSMAYVAFLCADSLTEELKKTEMYRLFTEIEMPLIFSLYRMERAGIRVERDRLKEYGGRLMVRIEEVEQKIYRETGETFNINSPKQLGEVLFDRMKLPGGKKTKSGYSTAADVLEKLAGDYPVIQMILDYRQLTKLNSTYAEGLAAYIGPDERIHGTFNQTITATGRISSTEPNLQNIPVRMELGREIRRIFVPEKGCVFVDADYSQIELRLLAHMSGDERLIGAYRHADDIHAITASQVFHTPLFEVTPLQRRNAKAVNFGIVYGISSFGLSEGLSISQKEAKEYINKYFETYPGVKEFLDKLVADAKETGYAVSLFGRRRPAPELKSSNFMQRSFGERAAMNAPLQGTAADIMKIAMVRVDQALRKEGLKSRIVLQIHDELLIEAPKEEAERIEQLLVEEMKHAADLKVTLEVEAHAGNSWFDAK